MSLELLKKIPTSFLENSISRYFNINRKKPLKRKTRGSHKKCGRNNQGLITVRHKGKGNKKSYRHINPFLPIRFLVIEHLEYDPNRNAKIARMFSFRRREHFYSLASSKLEVGCFFSQTSTRLSQQSGPFGTLASFPLGTVVNSLGTTRRRCEGILQRTAGTFGQLIQKGEKFSLIKLSSGKKVDFSCKIFASVGAASHLISHKVALAKAGRNRRKNVRPTVRGVAMNSVDHPHGGGEGKSSPGRPSVNPWGKSIFSKKKNRK